MSYWTSTATCPSLCGERREEPRAQRNHGDKLGFRARVLADTARVVDGTMCRSEMRPRVNATVSRGESFALT